MSNIEVEAEIDNFHQITEDFEFFCSQIVLAQRRWTSPPNKSKIITRPFKLAQHQKDYVEFLDSDLSDKVVLKSRQKGFSTVTLAYFLWRVLYKTDQNILYLIHKEDKATEMLNMIRGILQSLNDLYKPDVKISKNGTIRCRTTGSTMLIRTAGDGDAPRSGTYSAIVCDELAYYKEKSQSNIMSAMSAACSNRIYISTPVQENDIYHGLVQAAEKSGTLYKHTHYDNCEEFYGSRENAELWYKSIAATLTPEQVAHELNCEFRGSLDDQVWTIEPHIYQSYTPNLSQRVIVSLDLGFAPDPTAILYAAEQNGRLFVFAEDQYQKYAIPAVAQLIRHKGYNIKYAVMDSAGKKVDQTSGLSCYTLLKQELARPVLTKKLPDQIEMTRIANNALLKGLVKIDPVTCKFLVEALSNMRWKNDKIPKGKYKHIHDAFVYLVYNWHSASRKVQRNLNLPSGMWLAI